MPRQDDRILIDKQTPETVSTISDVILFGEFIAAYFLGAPAGAGAGAGVFPSST